MLVDDKLPARVEQPFLSGLMGDTLPMGYLKLRRSQWIIGSFVLFAVITRFVPAIDLKISGLFFDGVSFPRDQWWQQLLHLSLNVFLAVSISVVVILYFVNRITRRHIANIDGRKVAYLLLVLVLGAGLIVNVALKDNFGRARPRSVMEFGGTSQFTPAFVVSRQCRTNCSFSSGDAAGGFFSLALAMALTKRRSMYVIAVAIGIVFASGRIVSGAHFFSDTGVSFFVMLLVADALRHFMLSGRSLEHCRSDAADMLDSRTLADHETPKSDCERTHRERIT